MSEEFTFDFERQLEPQPSFHVSTGHLDRGNGNSVERRTCARLVCSGGAHASAELLPVKCFAHRYEDARVL